MSDPRDEMPDEAMLLVAVTADPETSLPIVLIAVEGQESPCVLTPDEAFHLGMSIVESAHQVMALEARLIDKSVEERRQVIEMEAAFNAIEREMGEG